MILEIDGGHSGIRFSACHFIPRHEKCSRLHGHSYILRLRVTGDIGADGMVMDFVVLKKKLKAALGLDCIERVVLLEPRDGRMFCLAPVGIDEGWTLEQKHRLVTASLPLLRRR